MYTFTRDQLNHLLGETIGMFIEYRDVHGRDEEHAQIAAVFEMLDGLDATKELVAVGELKASDAGQIITRPDGWAASKFQLGQTVFVEGTDNEPYVVVGLRYAPYRHLGTPIWYYQLSEIGDRDLTTLFNGTSYGGPDTEERELSAEPFPIPGQICLGLQHPCGKPATHWFIEYTGDDWETRRSVEIAYCPSCFQEALEIERAAREDKTRVAA